MSPGLDKRSFNLKHSAGATPRKRTDVRLRKSPKRQEKKLVRQRATLLVVVRQGSSKQPGTTL